MNIIYLKHFQTGNTSYIVCTKHSPSQNGTTNFLIPLILSTFAALAGGATDNPSMAKSRSLIRYSTHMTIWRPLITASTENVESQILSVTPVILYHTMKFRVSLWSPFQHLHHRNNQLINSSVIFGQCFTLFLRPQSSELLPNEFYSIIIARLYSAVFYWGLITRVWSLSTLAHSRLQPELCHSLPFYDEICSRTLSFIRCCVLRKSV